MDEQEAAKATPTSETQTSQVEGSTLSATASAQPERGRKVFRRVGRELSDGDLTNPAVAKLLLDDLELAEEERDEYKGFVERFHQADKRADVLQERLNVVHAIDVLAGALFAIGGGIIGASPYFFPPPDNRTTPSIIFGVAMIVSGVVVKVIKK